jgi:hypothetical protein
MTKRIRNPEQLQQQRRFKDSRIVFDKRHGLTVLCVEHMQPGGTNVINNSAD